MLGRPVAHRLRADGFNVRVLSRSSERERTAFGHGIEISKGDIKNQASLRQALEGCAGVHINLRGGPKPLDYDRIEHRGTQAVVQAAQEAGIQQITYLSGYTIQEKNIRSAESQAKFNAEKAIQTSGIPYTIFRASWFMESLPLFVRGKQALIIGRQPHPLHWIAAADYACMVSRSYQTSTPLHKVLYIRGPEAYTMTQALQIYCQTVIPHVSISTIPVWLMTLLGRITFNAEWRSLAKLMAYYDQIGEEGEPDEADLLLGAPRTTLQEWCKLQHHNDAPPLKPSS